MDVTPAIRRATLLVPRETVRRGAEKAAKNIEKTAAPLQAQGGGSWNRSMSRRSQARAKAQSRRELRGDMSRIGAIASRVRPAKKRSLTNSAACGRATAKRVRAS